MSEVITKDDEHCFCDTSEDAVRAAYTVNIPAAVTLEGLAAVINSLSEALHALGGDRDENRQTIAALVKAAEAVTALLTTEAVAKTPDTDGIAKLIAHTQGRTTFRVFECFRGTATLVAFPDAGADPSWTSSVNVPAGLAVDAFEAGGLDGFDAFCRRVFAESVSVRSAK